MNILVKKEETTQKLPQLIKMSDTYKLVIPGKVEEKIRYLCRKFPSLEWSGVLFTRHTGSFKDHDLVITCEDIYPMDLGSSTFTSFNMDADVAGYMADNMELFGCELQLAHSHNKMAAFFSSTDLNTLKEEGNERNCFVSLIVNNEGSYCAAVTRKVKIQREVKVRTLQQDYEFFGDGIVQYEGDDGDNSEETHIVDTENIEYFMLDIEKETVENHLSYLDDRFEQIERKKAETKKVTQSYTQYPRISESENFYDWIHADDKVDWHSFTEEPESPVPEPDVLEEMEEEELPMPDPKIIHQYVCKMIAGSLILNVKKFDLKQYITRHLDKVYKKAFGDLEDSTLCYSFDLWCEFFIEYMINSYTKADPSIAELSYTDDYNVIIVRAICNELEPYKEKSKYIKAYIKALEKYL